MGRDSSMGRRMTRRKSAVSKAQILRKAFEVYDTDGSGSIDHEELRKLLCDLGWPCDDAVVQRAINVLDTDKSGEIGFSEFLKWTEFAYNARILYRDEMCSSPIRTPTSRGEPCEVQGKKSSPWICRPLQVNNQMELLSISGTPLHTVLEENVCEMEEEQTWLSSSENENKGLESRISTSFSSSERHGRRNSDASSGRERGSRGLMAKKTSARNDGLEFSAPIVRMATMTLGRDRERTHRFTTSRIRCRSIDSQLSPSHESRRRRRSRNESLPTGPRAHSKATARILWACEQLQSESMTNTSGRVAVCPRDGKNNVQVDRNYSIGAPATNPQGHSKGDSGSTPRIVYDSACIRRYSCISSFPKRFELNPVGSFDESDEDESLFQKTNSI